MCIKKTVFYAVYLYKAFIVLLTQVRISKLIDTYTDWVNITNEYINIITKV